MDTCNTVKQMKQTVAGRHHGMDTGQVSRDSIRFLSRYELVGFTFWASLAHFSEPTSLAGLLTWLILSCNDDFNCDYDNNDDWLTCQSTFMVYIFLRLMDGHDGNGDNDNKDDDDDDVKDDDDVDYGPWGIASVALAPCVWGATAVSRNCWRGALLIRIISRHHSCGNNYDKKGWMVI